ncbi:hypothetical protein HAX54_025075, partial [Datura stramonium]|nr:hypothetical protein [Datura stramonium]
CCETICDYIIAVLVRRLIPFSDDRQRIRRNSLSSCLPIKKGLAGALLPPRGHRGLRVVLMYLAKLSNVGHSWVTPYIVLCRYNYKSLDSSDTVIGA